MIVEPRASPARAPAFAVTMATMPKFAASVSWLFQEVPLLERFQLAAAAGFRAVEVQAPYDEPAEALAEQLDRHNLEAVLINIHGQVLTGQGGEGATLAASRRLRFPTVQSQMTVHRRDRRPV
ncbi:MAG: hypothetical protein GY953_19545, partial [bacterium]|nr:hypothetical protein [bacterium]